MKLLSFTFAALAFVGSTVAKPPGHPPKHGKGLGTPLKLPHRVAARAIAARNGPGLGDPVPIPIKERSNLETRDMPALVARNATSFQKRAEYWILPAVDQNAYDQCSNYYQGTYPDTCFSMGDPHPGWGMHSWIWGSDVCYMFYYSGYQCNGIYLGSTGPGPYPGYNTPYHGWRAPDTWPGQQAMSWMLWCPGDP